MNSMKIIIVDDEPLSQEALQQVLEEYCPDETITGIYSSIDDAYKAIEKDPPDLIFLDIEMPEGTGFDLLSRFTEIPFEVIFVTGYDKYAINAIKFSCLDYILKPFTINEVIEAIRKAQLKRKDMDVSKRIETLISNLNTSSNISNRIGIPTQFGLNFITIEDIIRLEADGSYSLIHLKDQKPILCTRILKEFETLLEDQESFFRIHRKHLVNLKFISKYHKGDGGYVVMVDGTSIDVSRRKKEEFLKRLKSF